MIRLHIGTLITEKRGNNGQVVPISHCEEFRGSGSDLWYNLHHHSLRSKTFIDLHSQGHWPVRKEEKMAKDPVFDYLMELVHFYRKARPRLVEQIRNAESDAVGLIHLELYLDAKPIGFETLVFAEDSLVRQLVQGVLLDLRCLQLGAPPAPPPEVDKFLYNAYEKRPFNTPY
jgi:hypothetical protein